MAKKPSTRDYVAFRYRIDSLDTGRSKAEVLGTLIDAAESGSGVLPNGWDVTWMWQNKPGGIWREDTFSNAVSNSRGGFLSLMARRLRRDYRDAVGSEFIGIPIREAAEAEELELEELSEELLEERRGHERISRIAKRRARGKKRKVQKHRHKVSKMRKVKPKRKDRRRRRKTP